MNRKPLTKDHGAPIRLIVPGWYGCACIKWVNKITLVDETAEATSQMQEFAVRTGQQGVPKLPRDYKPATIDQAAMPTRIEKWLVNDRIDYRVNGILWGGSRPVKAWKYDLIPKKTTCRCEWFNKMETILGAPGCILGTRRSPELF